MVTNWKLENNVYLLSVWRMTYSQYAFRSKSSHGLFSSNLSDDIDVLKSNSIGLIDPHRIWRQTFPFYYDVWNINLTYFSNLIRTCKMVWHDACSLSNVHTHNATLLRCTLRRRDLMYTENLNCDRHIIWALILSIKKWNNQQLLHI